MIGYGLTGPERGSLKRGVLPRLFRVRVCRGRKRFFEGVTASARGPEAWSIALQRANRRFRGRAEHCEYAGRCARPFARTADRDNAATFVQRRRVSISGPLYTATDPDRQDPRPVRSDVADVPAGATARISTGHREGQDQAAGVADLHSKPGQPDHVLVDVEPSAARNAELEPMICRRSRSTNTFLLGPLWAPARPWRRPSPSTA